MRTNFVVSIICVLFYVGLMAAQDFDVILNVTDGSNAIDLTIGVDPLATEGYDSNIDQYAPPEPPDGSFDARLKWNNDSWIKDLRYNSLVEKTFVMEYKAASGEGPIVITWDNQSLIGLGTFTLKDNLSGDLVPPLDMTTTGELDVSSNSWYDYGVKIVVVPEDPSGTGSMDTQKIPEDFLLVNAYPNPFNPSTNIELTLGQSAMVSIDVYNLSGQKVKSLFNGFKQPGVHNLKFLAAGLSDGVYFVEVAAGPQRIVKKVTLVK